VNNNVALLAGDPAWLSLLKAVVILLFMIVSTIVLIWAERRLLGRMQHRPGPNRVGQFGLLQTVADAIKLGLKEDIRPKARDVAVYALAPVATAVPALVTFSVIPIGPEVTMFGHRTALQVADLPVSVLLVLAASSVGAYGVLLAGWSSGSPYPLLGSMRGAAQVISYEIAMGLSIAAVVLFAGTLSTSGIVAAQQPGWFIYLIPSAVIYAIAALGESNRVPFDLAEGESELVGGFHTEYSGLRWAMFFLAEYINMINLSAIGITLFFGGWRAPWPVSLWAGANTGWWPMLWFFIKLVIALFVFIWIRGTLPRIRYDQFMRLGWKVLVPVSLVWFMLVVAIRALRGSGQYSTSEVLIGIGVLLVILVAAALLVPRRGARGEGGDPGGPKSRDETLQRDQRRAPNTGSYPVPPADLRVPEHPERPRRDAGPRPSPAAVGGREHERREQPREEDSDERV
jgi:NADH-quinone oxidoreductase subunit H